MCVHSIQRAWKNACACFCTYACVFPIHSHAHARVRPLASGHVPSQACAVSARSAPRRCAANLSPWRVFGFVSSLFTYATDSFLSSFSSSPFPFIASVVNPLPHSLSFYFHFFSPCYFSSHCYSFLFLPLPPSITACFLFVLISVPLIHSPRACNGLQQIVVCKIGQALRNNIRTNTFFAFSRIVTARQNIKKKRLLSNYQIIMRNQLTRR